MTLHCYKTGIVGHLRYCFLKKKEQLLSRMETPQNQRGIWELFSKYPVVLPQPYFESIFDIINTPYTVINLHVPPKKWCSNVKSANTCTNITFKCKTLQLSAKRLNKCTITQQYWHCRHLPMYRISLYLIPYCSWLLNLGYVYKNHFSLTHSIPLH